MQKTYSYPRYPYQTPAALGSSTPERRPVIVVGAGPVGLAAALDCRVHGLPVLLLDEDDTVSIGSRGLCYAKRTLEVLNRIGCADPVINKGVRWNVGRTFHREQEVYRFNLQPEPDHKYPGMVNLQQYYLEQYLVEAALQAGVELRWRNRVVSVQPVSEAHGERVRLQVQTPDGVYALEADWLIAADGARSPIRQMLGLELDGRVFMDRFLIADVVMKTDFPAERWFWFDPPFHPGQSVLLHRQADNLYRIDFQLGWQADPQQAAKPENVIPLIRRMLGQDCDFELEWVSVYTFQCQRLKEFRAGRVLFVGDAAHQVSPFGARGANSGLQDTDNLVWKLKLVLTGQAPEALLDSYSQERGFAADENILNATRSTDFITPKTRVAKTFRDAVLSLAEQHPFARKLVNSGRLSVPALLAESSLNTALSEACDGDMVPGAPLADGPTDQGWLIDHLGNRFQLLLFVERAEDARPELALIQALAQGPIPLQTLLIARRPGAVPGVKVLVEQRGVLSQRYDGRPGSALLLRPDQHLAARWRRLSAPALRTALARASGQA